MQNLHFRLRRPAASRPAAGLQRLGAGKVTGRTRIYSRPGARRSKNLSVVNLFRPAGIPGADEDKVIMRILVVEDDFISRRLLCRYLETFGECDVAVNGNEAVAAVRQSLTAGEPYDLVCLDIMMPGLSGHETLQEVRRLEAQQGGGGRIRIIMTTALEDKETVARAFAAQADGYVTKPIDKRRFIETLRDLGMEPVLRS
jgi:two-component system chemotaxis response regulator CheY